ncbi:c-type cytochrome biogenesis protein CcmI [Marinobacter zhanjiangensis]|uniref:Cytochrome c-type biogenesis protein CycH n=1 Tax=Marinobacter zhanjiangensis TaxID=578215 RepID=A0ABQ3APM6_9GAMM|nr:c-type cytochrome biogenesis protein CcmI [Marinobacter zhanjiangensis]GGY63913.1 cytochrome c-type biogenesis protein CycH [Marinobacter zhanjiangensis]
MTNIFWIITAVLVVLAFLFILYPLVFGRPEQRINADIRNQNLLAYRTRLTELEEEYQQGIIDEENFRMLRDELAGSMLDDVGEEQAPKEVRAEDLRMDRRRRSTWAVAVVAAVLLPAGVVLLYEEWGALGKVEQYQAMQEMERSEGGDRLAQMEQLTSQLRERLEAEPDNPDGWAMLGRSLMRMERYPEAARAFEQLADVVEDSNGKAVAWGLSAQAWFFDSQGALTDEVTNAMDRARELNPNEVNTLGLLGIHAFERENFEEAIRHWEKIIEVAPDHPQIASIREGVAQAYQRLDREVPESAQPQASAAGEELSDRGVSVRVELDESFANEVAPDTTLFVYARTPNSQTAPLAVARLTAGQLPVNLRLDDSMSMAPQFRISGADEVVLAARISPSGAARPQPGDYQGIREEPVPVVSGDSDPVVLTIDQQLR